MKKICFLLFTFMLVFALGVSVSFSNATNDANRENATEFTSGETTSLQVVSVINATNMYNFKNADNVALVVVCVSSLGETEYPASTKVGSVKITENNKSYHSDMQTGNVSSGGIQNTIPIVGNSVQLLESNINNSNGYVTGTCNDNFAQHDVWQCNIGYGINENSNNMSIEANYQSLNQKTA